MAYIEAMEGQKYIDKTREYLDYLEKHLNNVKRAFNELSDICKDMYWVADDCSWWGVRWSVMNHDLSKFTKREFTQYRDYFFPVDDIDKEFSDFELAWENHKTSNNHHHETVQTCLDVVHMVIDWMAMSYKFGNTPREYYEKNKDSIKLSDEHLHIMNEIFDRIDKAAKGE